MNQARQTRGRSYSSSPISRKRGTRSNVAKYDCLLLRAPNKLKKTIARLRSFYSTALKIWGQKSTKTKQLLMQKDYTMCRFLLVMTVYYIYRLFPFPRFCKTTQRLIFLQHSTQFIIHCHPDTRQYPRIISASGSQSFFYRDALEEWRPHTRNTWKMTSTCAKHLKNDFYMRETLEEWRLHTRNAWGMTSTYSKHLTNEVHKCETLEEWRLHARNTWGMKSTCAKHLRNDVHIREMLEGWSPHARNTWGMMSTYAKHLTNDVHTHETLEVWRPHARNTWGMMSTCAKHLRNDVHMCEILEEWRPRSFQ
jgi:hypothetical protein